jgi:hypothetical protein
MRNKTLLAALIAVCLPAAAFGAHPATPANSNANSKANGTSTTGASSKANSNAQTKMIFVLHGNFGTYTPVNGTTNGSIVVTVTAANHDATMLKAAGPLTFTISPSTKLAGTLKSGDQGIVKVRAAKNASAATLQTITAFQVIDQGTAS